MATSTTNNLGTPGAPNTAKVKKPRRRKLLLVVLGSMLVTGIVGAGAYYLLGYDQPDKPAVVVPEDPIYVALQAFTVNLQPNDKYRMLHTVVTLQVANTQSQAMVTKYLPLVHGLVLSVLSNRQSDVLLTKEDKAKLSEEIKATLNKPFAPNLPPAEISKVELFPFMFQ